MFQAILTPGERPLMRRCGAASFLLMLAPLALGQYPGRIKPDEQKKPDEPRAVSILEWVGEPGKPVAGRIVPLSVFIHGGYQDGGLYLAQPAPLTVETDTLYELQQAGIPKGDFYVAGGQEIGGAWFGYGKWKPLAAPKPPPKLAASKVPPKVIEDHDPDRPHFKGSGTSSGSSTPGGSSSGGSATPQDDPDKPTLHRAPGAGGSSPSAGSSGSASSTASADDPDKPTLHRRGADSAGSSGAGSAPEDPDRPHLKKRSAAEAAADADDGGAPVTSVNESDPDRPKLSRGKPASLETPLQETRLTGIPANLQQMAAISDPVNREQHSFNYPWPDPAQAATMQAAVEQLAIKAVLTDGISPAERIGPAPATARPAKAPPPKGAGARKAAPQPPAVVLSDKDFRAYELSYSGGATLVFTARATIGGAGSTEDKYVTIIAQPDFNGDPQPRLQSVTDARHQDITPRMKIIDAVDTDGDDRAEMIFELMRSSDRQFAIYKIKGSQAEQAFATESVPYVSPSHSVETSSN